MKNQEKFKEIMEQLRSQKTSNNVAKVSVQEKAVGNMNARSITQGEEEEMYSTPLNKSLASLTTYSYQTTPENVMGAVPDSAIIGLMLPNYYYAEFRMDLTTVANYFDITEEKLRSCFLVVTPENVSSGYCAFTIVNSVGDTLLTWNNNVGGEIELSVEDVYNGEQDEIYFKLMPMMGINGMVGFPICGVALKKNTPFMKNVYYGNESQEDCSLQVMDIYVPKNADGTYKAGTFPAVITIHGGAWRGGSKEDYNYMTEYITNTCNCVHVNMNYRLTTGSPGGNNITYVDMLKDIQSVIEYLNTYWNSYHIDTSKIALMGYSAGGHLALLYAYKERCCRQSGNNCDECTLKNSCNNIVVGVGQNPISLVISEAGPTCFVDKNNNVLHTDPFICAMAGVEYRGEGYIYQHNNPSHNNYEQDLYEVSILSEVSPLIYANNNSPYTILAYGSNLNTPPDNLTFTSGDGFLPYSQATAVYNELGASKCSLFELTDVAHGEFGEDENGDPKKMHPESSKSGEWNQARAAYYQKIQELT